MLRKIILLFSVLCAVTSHAADNRIVLPDGVDNITFYGVDFSQVSIVGDDAPDQQYLQAFRRINDLFVTEPKKYNIGKKLPVTISDYDFKVVADINAAIDLSEARSFQAALLNDETLADHIAQLPVTGNGVGLIIVADCLDKIQETGYFHFVFFDQSTRAIVAKTCLSGKARGFGLRNHWARAMLNCMRVLRVVRQ